MGGLFFIGLFTIFFKIWSDKKGQNDKKSQKKIELFRQIPIFSVQTRFFTVNNFEASLSLLFTFQQIKLK